MIEALVSSDEDAPEAEETPTESLSRIVKAANSRERLSEMAAAARRAAEQIEAGALNVEQVAAGPRIGTLHVAPSTVGGASTWETTGREACGRYELASEA